MHTAGIGCPTTRSTEGSRAGPCDRAGTYEHFSDDPIDGRFDCRVLELEASLINSGLSLSDICLCRRRLSGSRPGLLLHKSEARFRRL